MHSINIHEAGNGCKPIVYEGEIGIDPGDCACRQSKMHNNGKPNIFPERALLLISAPFTCSECLLGVALYAGLWSREMGCGTGVPCLGRLLGWVPVADHRCRRDGCRCLRWLNVSSLTRLCALPSQNRMEMPGDSLINMRAYPSDGLRTHARMARRQKRSADTRTH